MYVVLKNLLRNVILFYKISQMFRVVNETVIKQSCERLFQHVGAHLHTMIVNKQNNVGVFD